MKAKCVVGCNRHVLIFFSNKRIANYRFRGTDSKTPNNPIDDDTLSFAPRPPKLDTSTGGGLYFPGHNLLNLSALTHALDARHRVDDEDILPSQESSVVYQ